MGTDWSSTHNNNMGKLVCFCWVGGVCGAKAIIGAGLGTGRAHSHSADEWVKLKQLLPQPGKAMFQRVGSTRAYTILGSKWQHAWTQMIREKLNHVNNPPGYVLPICGEQGASHPLLEVARLGWGAWEGARFMFPNDAAASPYTWGIISAVLCERIINVWCGVAGDGPRGNV